MAEPRVPKVLVVEDNPFSRKMVRFALESEGWEVLEAPDATSALELLDVHAPDLVLQDLALPDLDGIELLARLRIRLGSLVPLVVLSGRTAKLEELKGRSGLFDDFLTKPVELSRLVQVAKHHLGHGRAEASGAGRGRHVLLVDDDPLGRKLASLRLKHEGFQVTVTHGAAQAFDVARIARPDAILADVLMPGIDGFRLCQMVRSEPGLAALPVVLFSAAYGEEADRVLARDVGANALVARSPDYREAIDALALALGGGTPPAPRDPRVVDREHEERLSEQLGRQIAANRLLLQRAALHAATLSVLTDVCDALSRPEPVPDLLAGVLAHCLDATGLSAGLLYVTEGDRLVLKATNGLPRTLDVEAGRCFEHADLFREVLRSAAPAAFEAFSGSTEAADLLRRLNQASLLAVPLVAVSRTHGLLLLCSDDRSLADPGWHAFARALSAQVGQAVALGQALGMARASESALRESEERYRALFEENPMAMWEYDSDTLRILAANQAAAEQYGYSKEELEKLTLLDIRPAEDAEKARSAIQDAPPGRRFAGVWKHRKKDGTLLDVEIHSSDATVAGRKIRLAVLHDVTAQRTLGEQLRHSQKLEAVGRLAGGIAHDFNNLLTVVLGFSDMLLARLTDETSRADVLEIRKAGERAAALTRQLLAFSRRQVLVPEVIDLAAVVRSVSSMLQRLIGEDVAMRVEASEPLAPVEADPGQMEQVVMNLAVNARDAMPRGGTLTFALRNVEPASVMLEVRDTGTGMDAETKAKVFEPFFTTKEQGKGTGLGLSMAHGIVSQSGGTIEVESAPGAGTTFRILLPRASRDARTTQTPSGALPLPKGTGTILVVEDDAQVRRLAALVLAQSGHAVLEAEAPEEALALARAHAADIRLVVTDVVLPGMDGKELVRSLASILPGVRVLFMSGHTDRAIVENGVLEAGTHFLQKPFTPGKLMRKVREVLAS